MTETVHTVLVIVEAHIPHAQSIKQKRAVVKSLTDKLRSRLNASVAETGYLDEWQRSVISISMVSNSRRYLQQQVDLVEQLTTSSGDWRVTRFEHHWL